MSDARVPSSPTQDLALARFVLPPQAPRAPARRVTPAWRLLGAMAVATLAWGAPLAARAQAAASGPAQGGAQTASAAVPSPAARQKAVQATYDADVAACHSGQRGQALAPCLKEAAVVRAEALRLPMAAASSPSAAELQANRRKRCEPLPEAQRGDCLRLADGDGVVEGSVGGGGQLKTLTTRSVAPRPAAPAASAAAGG